MSFYPAFQTQRRVPPPSVSALPRNDIDFNDDPDLTIYDRPVQWSTDVDDRYRTSHEALRAPSTLNSSVPTTPINRSESVGLSAPRAVQQLPRQNSYQTGFASPNPMILNTALRPGGPKVHSSGNSVRPSGPTTYPTITSGHPSVPSGYPSGASGYPSGASGHPSGLTSHPSGPSGFTSGTSGFTSGPYVYPSGPSGFTSGASGYPKGPSVISGHPSGPSGYTGASSGYAGASSGYAGGSSGYAGGSSGYAGGSSGYASGSSGYPGGYPSVTSGYPSGLTGLASGTIEHPNAPSLYHPSGAPTVQPREIVPTAPLASVNFGAPTYDEPSFDFSVPPSRSMWDP